MNDMRKAQFGEVREFLKRAFSTRDSSGVFAKLPEELADAYFRHCELIEAIGLAKLRLAEAENREMLDRAAANLEANLQYILACISSLTGRTVIPYDTEDGDTLWKISKRHPSELNEILKLNNLESVILPPGTIRLLIPIKGTESN